MQEQPNISSGNKTPLVTNKWIILLSVLAILSLITSIVLWRVIYMKKVVEVPTIFDGIYINQVDVSELTKEQAADKLKESITQELKDKTVTLSFNENTWKYSYSELGVTYDFKDAIQQAYDIGHSGSLLDKYNAVTGLKSHPRHFEIKFLFDNKKIKKIVQQVSTKVDQKPVDANIHRSNGDFRITEEIPGIKVDIPNTISAIETQLKKHEVTTLPLVMEDNAPKITAVELKKIKVRISQFATRFKVADSERVENLRVATSKLNGSVIMPGEVLSLDHILGPRTLANGYRNAHVIVNGEITDGIAGGICQVASTLYNATLLGNFEIVERRNHSLKSTYVPVARDATLSEGVIDYKFKNTTEAPIFVEAKLVGNQVYIAIYGEKKVEGSIHFETEVIQTYPPLAPEVVKDPTLPVGYSKVEREAKEGMKVKLYKILSKNGEVISKEVANTSYYPPVRQKVVIGTKQSS